MEYNLDLVEAMAKAARECWIVRDGLKECAKDWDEISAAEYLEAMDEARAALFALVKARPEIAQYVMEAPP